MKKCRARPIVRRNRWLPRRPWSTTTDLARNRRGVAAFRIASRADGDSPSTKRDLRSLHTLLFGEIVFVLRFTSGMLPPTGHKETVELAKVTGNEMSTPLMSIAFLRWESDRSRETGFSLSGIPVPQLAEIRLFGSCESLSFGGAAPQHGANPAAILAEEQRRWEWK